MKGFALMDATVQREIASLGGQAAHARGTAHEYDAEEGRRAAAKSTWLRRVATLFGVKVPALRLTYRESLERLYAQGSTPHDAVAEIRKLAA